MIFKKFSIVIVLLFSVCFVNAQTTIEVYITNYAWASYDIKITLYQTGVTPVSGPLNYTITPQSTTHKTLVFEETDICIDKIEATYNGTCEDCPTKAELDVDCTNFTGDDARIAPFDEGCYTFEYQTLQVINYGEKLKYYFDIHQL